MLAGKKMPPPPTLLCYYPLHAKKSDGAAGTCLALASEGAKRAAAATLQTRKIKTIDRSLDEQDRAIPSQYSAGTTQRTALNGEIPKLVAVAPHRTKAF